MDVTVHFLPSSPCFLCWPCPLLSVGEHRNMSAHAPACHAVGLVSFTPLAFEALGGMSETTTIYLVVQNWSPPRPAFRGLYCGLNSPLFDSPWPPFYYLICLLMFWCFCLLCIAFFFPFSVFLIYFIYLPVNLKNFHNSYMSP